MISGYPHFLGLASRLQWDEKAIDLSDDAAAWPRLDAPVRERLVRLIAGFCVGEAAVADALDPFAAAALDEEAAACFRAQERDEARHARFFDRVAAEVGMVAGASAEERRNALRHRLEPRFLALFEHRLPAVAHALSVSDARLDDAVGLYHMVLEGVVFTAGQLAILDLLEENPLPGVRRGVELVLRDERWHVGFGTRCLQDAHLPPGAIPSILAEGEAAATLWSGATGVRAAVRVVAILHRRLGAVHPAERETLH
ncbi:MAG: ribonucleotide-diphosphate reductase subunit beta [Solirubrobacteraceae bacterium]